MSTRDYPHEKEHKRRRLGIRLIVAINHDKCVEQSQKGV